MKAKELYDKYKDAHWEKPGVIHGYLTELNDDSKNLVEKRGIKDDRGLPAILREINDKHNALMRIFKKQQGEQPLIDDMFLAYWIDKIPGLKAEFPKVKPIGELTAQIDIPVPKKDPPELKEPLHSFHYVRPIEDEDGGKQFVVYDSADQSEIFRSDSAYNAMTVACALTNYPKEYLMNMAAASQLYTAFKGRSYRARFTDLRQLYDSATDDELWAALDILQRCGLCRACRNESSEEVTWYEIEGWVTDDE